MLYAEHIVDEFSKSPLTSVYEHSPGLCASNNEQYKFLSKTHCVGKWEKQENQLLSNICIVHSEVIL